MGTGIYQSVYIDASDVAEHCGNTPEFFADVFNGLGEDFNLSFTWLRDFTAGLDDTGKAALRAMVARLDTIPATSTEGR